MVEPTDTGHGHKSGRGCCPSLRRPPLGGFFPQPIMRAVLVIVAEVFTNQSAQDELRGRRSHPAILCGNPHPTFGNPVLPRTPIGRSNRLAAHGFDHFRYFFIELSISIQDHVSSSGNASLNCCTIHWLVGRSVTLKRRTLLRPWLIAKEAVMQTESSGRHRKEVHRHNHVATVLKKVNQRLRASPLRPTRARNRDTVRSEISVHSQQPTVDSGCSPKSDSQLPSAE